MTTATLTLSVSAKNKVVFTVRAGGPVQVFDGPPVSVAERLDAEMAKHEYSDAERRAGAIRPQVSRFQPPGYSTWFSQWTSDRDDDFVLCVHTGDSRLSALPWEQILLPSGRPAGRAWVVRVRKTTGSVPSAVPVPAEMLLAGWSSLTGYPMPGVIRELQEFSGKVDKQHLNVQALAEPTRKKFLHACAHQRVDFLHLSPPSLVLENGILAVPTTPESTKAAASKGPSGSSSAIAAVSLDDLTAALKQNPRLHMVVVNACGAGLRGCERIAERLNVVSIGWPALVTDDIAADFTFYFYQRLLEGWSPLLAVRSFARTIGTARGPVDVPVVWLPSPAWVGWQPFAGLATTEPVAREAAAAATVKKTPGRRRKPVAARPPVESELPAGAASSLESHLAAPPVAPDVAASGARLELEFRPRASINPALLVNGLHPIEHISIESPREQDVHLRIDCDTGGNVSTFRQTVQLKKGVVPVNSTEIHFPALHELIDRHAGRRRISFTATVSSLDGTELCEQTRTAVWMGAKEWLDQEDTWAFIPAFVNPFDEGVLEVFEHAKRVLRTLGNPTDSFDGYQRSGSPEYVSTQMKAIFQTLRDDSIGITYISPPGSPVFDTVSKRVTGQVVRTHGEVVKRKLGTCHDLALLVAACAEYVGIHPLIFLIPGHTFVGYWLDAERQRKYWAQQEGRLRTSKFGESWTITDGEELLRLLTKGQIALVEATFVCDQQKTFGEACRHRTDRFKLADKDTLDVAIDVFAARREIQPL